MRVRKISTERPNYVAVNLATGGLHDFFRLNMVRPLNGAFVYE